MTEDRTKHVLETGAMRIVDIVERAVPISRYADCALPSGGLTTSIVAVQTDVVRAGKPVVGYGFSSIGRFAQSGLIGERFAPRLLAANDAEVADVTGTNLDPFRCWRIMLRGEKPGGHGERCVAIGTLDMALWDAAAKIAGLPLHRFLAANITGARPSSACEVYAAGGYLYPRDDFARLDDELRAFLDLGYTRVKIKVGMAPLEQDARRVEAALTLLPSGDRLAVDAMNVYGASEALNASARFAPYRLWWFEDVCDPLDFEAQAAVARAYKGTIAAGEALFSAAEARLLDLYGGLERDRDVLLFDPVHCYGLPGYLQIVERLERSGWPRRAFWPHGGHLFTLHVVAALGLGGAEMNPFCFQPFGGLSDGAVASNGCAVPPAALGIGFETKTELFRMFRSLH